MERKRIHFVKQQETRRSEKQQQKPNEPRESETAVLFKYMKGSLWSIDGKINNLTRVIDQVQEQRDTQDTSLMVAVTRISDVEASHCEASHTLSKLIRKIKTVKQMNKNTEVHL
ncbi:hypothetical protein NDU88_004723 [Pleurodeles waltl]|uniref:Uncharacterized protein n=1 Tax=Pleurodeles waltl TaxID=8319 RepID=A0AAV7RI67_PLEWA|nr:hypothetical protein NDU88_004723 [Pleurodeles waltl]